MPETLQQSTPDALSIPTLRRLPAYLRLLRAWRQEGRGQVSCTAIADALSLHPVQVRKDLSGTGATGRPRIGFTASDLIDAIEAQLGLEDRNEAFVVGAGPLAAAILGHEEVLRSGLRLLACFDHMPNRSELLGRRVLSMERLPDLVERMHVHIAILAVPEADAQTACDACVTAGITTIWNLSAPGLLVPSGVVIETLPIAASLALLLNRRTAPVETSHALP